MRRPQLKSQFKVYSTEDEVYWTQKVKGDWPDFQPVNMSIIDKFLPFSVIKWTHKDHNTSLWGMVNSQSKIIAYGVPSQFPYVINRLFLHYLIKMTIIRQGNIISISKANIY